MNSEIAIAVTGISLFLYAFKLCEYFEIELCKALKRRRELGGAITRAGARARARARAGAIASQEMVIKWYKHRFGLVLFPNILLLGSFIIAIFVYVRSFYDPVILPLLGYFDFWHLAWIILYVLGAGIPVFGAGIPMIRRPTIKYFEAMYSEIRNINIDC